jgi:ribosomal protein S19
MRLNYFSENMWRNVFLYQKNPIFKISEKRIYNRSSRIPKILINYNVCIHSGKIWNTRFVTKWMVGFKFGEFTWNKKVALYKAKQLKKKKK